MATMKPWHTVALMLVSWIMLIPPLVNAPYKINMQAPISSWQRYRAFNTSDECDQAVSAAKAKYNPTASAELGTIKKGSRAFALQMSFAQCVSSDSPDLKAR
jgi:hypothetical protein